MVPLRLADGLPEAREGMPLVYHWRDLSLTGTCHNAINEKLNQVVRNRMPTAQASRISLIQAESIGTQLRLISHIGFFAIIIALTSCIGQGSEATKIPIQYQLHPDVVESLFFGFYEDHPACTQPSLADLEVVETWRGEKSVELVVNTPVASPLDEGVYYLTLVGTPLGPDWHLNGVLELDADHVYRAFHIDNSVSEERHDAYAICVLSLGGIPDSGILHVDADNFEWEISIVSSRQAGMKETLPTAVRDAIDSYHGDCPKLPPIEDLNVQETWTGNESQSLNFTALPNFYFIGVRFEPKDRIWFFESTLVDSTYSSPGPSVDRNIGELIDFVGGCLTFDTSMSLEVESGGGDWEIYLIAAVDQSN